MPTAFATPFDVIDRRINTASNERVPHE